MKGLQIFTHSLRQVTGNLEGALKVSALPYAAQVLATLVLIGPGMMTGQGDPAAILTGEGATSPGLFLVNMVVALVTSIWMAVAWHRYVLMNEAPAGFVPAFQGDRVWAYFLRALGVGLLCVLLVIPFGLIATVVASPFIDPQQPSFMAMLIVILVTYFPIAVISYRLSAALPAAALGEGSGFMAGWEATKGESATIAGLSLISILVFFGGSVIGTFVLGGLQILSLAWSIAFNWGVMMVSVSILTTLYGHYIEKRALT